MNYKPLPIGISDFEKLITNGCYYVDKTPMIKDILDNKSETVLSTRPRRFGKTLNMSSLDVSLRMWEQVMTANRVENIFLMDLELWMPEKNTHHRWDSIL